MLAYHIEFNAAAAMRTLEDFPTKTRRAASRALNRALVTGKAVLARAVSQDMGLKVGVVKDAIKDRKSTFSNLEIRLAASLKRIPVIEFGATGPYPSRGRGRGVSWRGPAGRVRVSNAFIAIMPTGHRGVFTRGNKRQRSSGRLPITELRGASIGRVFDKHRQAGIDAMSAAFATTLASELKFAETERV